MAARRGRKRPDPLRLMASSFQDAQPSGPRGTATPISAVEEAQAAARLLALRQTVPGAPRDPPKAADPSASRSAHARRPSAPPRLQRSDSWVGRRTEPGSAHRRNVLPDHKFETTLPRVVARLLRTDEPAHRSLRRLKMRTPSLMPTWGPPGRHDAKLEAGRATTARRQRADPSAHRSLRRPERSASESARSRRTERRQAAASLDADGDGRSASTADVGASMVRDASGHDEGRTSGDRSGRPLQPGLLRRDWHCPHNARMQLRSSESSPCHARNDRF